MGWIATRAMRSGGSLYEGGPKRKGPLRRIVETTTTDRSLFGSDSGWLECGHHLARIFGRERAVCEKCGKGLPKDIRGEDGWPIEVNADAEAGGGIGRKNP